MSDAEAKAMMEKAFYRWGLPRRIKIDNGYPFVNIRSLDLPSLLVLWWIGLGIEVTFNRPATPQQNGTVEGLQNISNRWVNPALYSSAAELQLAMDEVVRRQRETYRIPSKGHKTRAELYPELEKNLKMYDPGAFSIQRVKEYLAQQVFERHVGPKGSISFSSCTIYLGYKYRKQTVTVTYDPLNSTWIVRSVKGQDLLVMEKPFITEQHILNLIPISKNE